MSTRRRSFFAILLVAVMVMLGLASDGMASAHPTGTPPSHANAKTPKIVIDHFSFVSVPKKVKPGAQIAVYNNDCCTHTVTSDDRTSFHLRLHPHKSGFIQAPMTPGTYPFHCAIHPSMQATLIVKGP